MNEIVLLPTMAAILMYIRMFYDILAILKYEEYSKMYYYIRVKNCMFWNTIEN